MSVRLGNLLITENASLCQPGDKLNDTHYLGLSGIVLANLRHRYHF